MRDTSSPIPMDRHAEARPVAADRDQLDGAIAECRIRIDRLRVTLARFSPPPQRTGGHRYPVGAAGPPETGSDAGRPEGGPTPASVGGAAVRLLHDLENGLLPTTASFPVHPTGTDPRPSAPRRTTGRRLEL